LNGRSRPTREMATAALLAALMAASSLVAIPVGPVPITLQTFVVVLAALLLPPMWAGAAMGVYLLLGAVGVPVFAGGTGGLGILIGPTGGYLWGFAFGAVLGATARTVLERRHRSRILADGIGAVATIALIYVMGVTQLLAVTRLGAGGLSLQQAMVAGVVPFIGIDAAKGAVAVAVAEALRRTGVVPSARRSGGPVSAAESQAGG
jgi:biotin transport system substrate-specific component